MGIHSFPLIVGSFRLRKLTVYGNSGGYCTYTGTEIFMSGDMETDINSLSQLGCELLSVNTLRMETN